MIELPVSSCRSATVKTLMFSAESAVEEPAMDVEQIEKKKQEIVDRFGPWTAHCIHLANGVYTFDHAEVDPRLRRMLQICSDIVLKPLNNTRVLDLACLEGHFGIEFALHGCDVLALEGREANLAKA